MNVKNPCNPSSASLACAVVVPAIALLAAGAGPARAADVPLGVTFGPGENVTYDSNVLRLAPAAQPAGGGGDTSSVTSLTGTLHETYSREDVTASATLGRVLFHKFTYLDYTQQDVHGTVKANLPLNVEASVTASHNASLAHFADIGNTNRNVITRNDVNGYLDVPVWVDWRAVIGGDGAQSRNSSDLFRTQNFNTAEVNGGIRYQPTTGNHVDLLVRTVNGTYVDGSPASFVGPSYRDNAADLSADWTFAGSSLLHGRAGYVRRKNDDYEFPEVNVNGQPVFEPSGARALVNVDRNFSGPAFDLTYLWQLSAITSVKLFGQRQAGAAGDNSYQSAVTHTYRITPSYQPTAKTELDAYVEFMRRDYDTSVLVALGQTPGTQRLDHSHSVGLTAIWTPRRWVQATLDLHHDIRDSTNPLFTFTDTTVSAQVQGTF